VTQQVEFDVVVIGGGPSGATSATDLARAGRRVLLIDKMGRIKPCGGAIPPRLMREFEIPESLLTARISAARMVAPSQRHVDIPIEGGFVGMVDREVFDPWLRERAAAAGAHCCTGTFLRLERDQCEGVIVHFRTDEKSEPASVRARLVIGADGARSEVARQEIAAAKDRANVFAYHEVIRTPAVGAVDPARCEVIYDAAISPDFYGWSFPHGATLSVGTGSCEKGFSQRQAVAQLRQRLGLGDAQTLRREGAPLPMRPLGKWDNGKDVILAGDAAGVVAPASGEGIYYAMLGGRLAAQAAAVFLDTGRARSLGLARRRFMRSHGLVFWILGIMQRFWYRSDERRERFVAICRDADVQRLTFEAYMNKRLVRARPLAHVRILLKDVAHLMGMVSP
jgi:geranylgeranyl reductase